MIRHDMADICYVDGSKQTISWLNIQHPTMAGLTQPIDSAMSQKLQYQNLGMNIPSGSRSHFNVMDVMGTRMYTVLTTSGLDLDPAGYAGCHSGRPPALSAWLSALHDFFSERSLEFRS
jgi:hypothetical protein